jgi:hypothetical protein
MRPRQAFSNFERAIAAVKADSKRASILCVLVIVLGIFWVRAIGSVAGPSKASAAGLAPAVSPAATPAPAGAIPRAYQLLRDWAKGPIEPVSRNLFYINYDAFPSDGSGKGKEKSIEKSEAWASDYQNRREKVQAFMNDAEDLRLQSILMGQEPKALLEGRLVREGDVVANFRVLKIEPRSVIVERENIRLEIKLK